MNRGARKLHRGVVNVGLKRAIDEAVRSGACSLRSLGFATGFPNAQILSTQLHNEFPCSRLNLSRWQRVAEISDFHGEAVLRGGVEDGEW